MRRHILIVEDNESDVFLIEEAIRVASLPVTLHVARDGEQAVRFLDHIEDDQRSPSPAVVILDINLPRKPGSEVLKYLRRSPRCAATMVIAISTSDSPRDRDTMMQLGADGYFHKPSRYTEFMQLGELIRHFLAPNRERS